MITTYQKQVNLLLTKENTMEIIKRVTDKRKRTWECFVDRSYFDMYCVRVEGDRDFNSPYLFILLLKQKLVTL